MRHDEESFRSGDEFTSEQALRMLDLYDSALERMGYEPVAYPDMERKLGTKLYGSTKTDALNHARWMCGQAKRFVKARRFEKAYRWIGMIQGLLFMGGVYSLAELRYHNEPA